MPHVLRMKTWGTTFAEISFDVPNEWVRFWSNTSLVTNHKTSSKKLFAAHPKTIARKRNTKKKKDKAKVFLLQTIANNI